MTDVGLIAARFAHYVALMIAFGGFAYSGFTGGDGQEARAGRLRRITLWSSLGVLVGSMAVLIATVAGLGGSYAAALDGSIWSAVLQETDFGRVWLVRLVLSSALVLTAALALRRAPRVLRWMGLVLIGGLLTTVALTGHAQIETGAVGVVHRAADAVHLLAAAAWIGALPPLLVLLARTGPSRTVEHPEAAARRLQAFHTVGLAAVLLLITTGLINSWFLVGSVEGLVTTPYGALLLAKLALFLGMVALAAGNRLRLVPALTRRLATSEDPQRVLARLRLHIGAELFLAVLVLLTVSVMGAIAPARTSF